MAFCRFSTVVLGFIDMEEKKPHVQINHDDCECSQKKNTRNKTSVTVNKLFSYNIF